MKTKEQILEHLMEVGYKDNAMEKIMGFMIGKDLKTPDENITYKKGNNDFDHFLSWFNGETKTDMEHIKDLIDFLKVSKDNRIKKEWIEVLHKADVFHFLKDFDVEIKNLTNAFNKRHKKECKPINENAIDEFFRRFYF